MYLQSVPPCSRRPVLSIWKAPVAFSVGDQDRLSSRLGLPEPPASGCTDHSSSSFSDCRNNTVSSDSMVCKLGASHFLLCEEGQERANFQAVDGTIEAQRLPVSLLGSGRTKTLALGEGTEALPMQACSQECKHQQRTPNTKRRCCNSWGNTWALESDCTRFKFYLHQP